MKKHIPSMFDYEISQAYDNIILPTRATKHSAGYDFYLPYFIAVKDNARVLPTGIRAVMPDDVVLQLYPRSGMGFKYGFGLRNTVGVIDSDYYYSDNEGHIMASVKTDGMIITIAENQAFMQGVFQHYLTTDDDNVDTERNGGFGSTDKKVDENG